MGKYKYISDLVEEAARDYCADQGLPEEAIGEIWLDMAVAMCDSGTCEDEGFTKAEIKDFKKSHGITGLGS
jgi:hypothetical protein